jgi:hypothetical protein
VETRSVHRGRHADTPSLLTACGTPDASGAFVATNSCAFTFAHGAADAIGASGVPRALSKRGRDVSPHTSGAIVSRECEAVSAITCLQSTLPLFDIRIRQLTHGPAAPPASSLRRQGPIRRVIHVAGSAYSAGTNQTELRLNRRALAIRALGYGSLPAQGRR